jgi:hypothetical protein
LPAHSHAAAHDRQGLRISRDAGQAISSGWAKGIEFIPDMGKVIGTQRDTLDDSAKLPGDVYLRKLEPQWFLFFQRDE